jgi:hypothetical protein
MSEIGATFEIRGNMGVLIMGYYLTPRKHIILTVDM